MLRTSLNSRIARRALAKRRRRRMRSGRFLAVRYNRLRPLSARAGRVAALIAHPLPSGCPASLVEPIDETCDVDVSDPRVRRCREESIAQLYRAGTSALI